MSEVTTSGPREPARVPPRITREAKFLDLLERRRLIDVQLGILAEGFALDPEGAPRLPKSGLRLVATNGVSLSRGGRAHG